MSVDPPHDEVFEKMLADVSRTLQENQRFLEALKHDRLADDEGLDEEETTVEEDFEEL